MRIARAMWAAVLAVCLEIPDVVAQECGSSSDQKVGLVAAGAATAGHGGFTTLRGAQACTTFVRGDSTYAIVAANDQSGIQIVDVSDPSNPVAVSSATDGEGGFTTLDASTAVTTFVRGTSTYAIVVAGQDNGNPESISYTSAAGETLFIIVDGYSASSVGSYTLDVVLTPAP